MSIENIIFEETDTLEQKATKTALLYRGSTELKKQMERLLFRIKINNVYLIFE